MNLHKDLTAYLNKENIILNSFQEEALVHTLGSTKQKTLEGQIFLPTGVGKTIVEVLTSLDALLCIQDKGDTGVAIFAAHRLLLCEQLLTQLINYASGIGMNFDILTVASDGLDKENVADIAELQGSIKDFNK
jgi:superfamily II DNA or RNA helicase